jgi:hypothetical protein
MRPKASRPAAIRWARRSCSFVSTKDGEHFSDWVAAADALVAIREEAMEVAKAPNNPKHPRYRAVFKQIITTRETWRRTSTTARGHIVIG